MNKLRKSSGYELSNLEFRAFPAAIYGEIVNDPKKSPAPKIRTQSPEKSTFVTFSLWILSKDELDHSENGYWTSKCHVCENTWNRIETQGYLFKMSCYNGNFSGCEFEKDGSGKYCSRECASRACERKNAICNIWQ